MLAVTGPREVPTTTFVLIHGGGDSGWAWHLVEHELRVLGHETVAPDLPVDRSPTLDECADAVVAQIGSPPGQVTVVAHSFGGFVGPLVAERLPTQVLVFVAGMVPSPGESPDDWWANTGYAEAVTAANHCVHYLHPEKRLEPGHSSNMTAPPSQTAAQTAGH